MAKITYMIHIFKASNTSHTSPSSSYLRRTRTEKRTGWILGKKILDVFLIAYSSPLRCHLISISRVPRLVFID